LKSWGKSKYFLRLKDIKIQDFKTYS